MQFKYIRPAWAEIDLDNLAYNIKQIRSFIGPAVKMMAVVKSDAYGAGIAGVLDTFWIMAWKCSAWQFWTKLS